MRWTWPAGWKKGLERYKYLLIAIVAGVLLLVSGDDGNQPKPDTEPMQVPAFQLSELERRLETALSKISGAGKVSVVLTLKESEQMVYAQDIQADQQEQTRTTVIVSRGSGLEQAILVQSRGPVFQGALAVCPGGANPTVKLEMTQAICALTGLSAEKVSVCKSEQ